MFPPLRTIVAFVTASACAGTILAQSPLQGIQVATGFVNPVFAGAPPGDFGRLFILEVGGPVRLLDISQSPPVLQTTPYMMVPSSGSASGEGGLLGLAFHPQFASNGLFYAYHTVSSTHVELTRYQANAPYMTSTSALVSSATPVLDFISGGAHFAGWMGFGPDGLLYVCSGDGGGGLGANAQDLSNLLGKVLRIDVDGDDFPLDPARNYSIPPTNPFYGSPNARPEIWTYGLRNPWRASFDRSNGDLWIGDVGHNAVEEIDRAPAGVGGLNFGWDCMEGSTCTGSTHCVCNDPALTPPVHEYTHGSDYCVIGGYRYRGSALCGFDGVYFFGDLSRRIWTGRWDGVGLQDVIDRTSELNLGNGSVTSFGEDAAGELYVVKYTQGRVFKIVPGTITDCNGNSVHDGCDIAAGTSHDWNDDGVPDECQPLGAAACFGDGSTPTPCPCGNSGASGHGCENSAATGGARLDGVGDQALDNVALISSGELPTSLTIFLQGNALNASGVVFGDGVRCVTGSLKRMYAKPAVGGLAHAPEATDPSITARSARLGDPLLPLSGQVRYYQAYYRDPSGVFCPAPAGNTWNISSLLAITW